LHNIGFRAKGQQWPATLLLTADHDDRVVPSHTLKYVAQLYHTVMTTDAKDWQKNPLLARIEVRAGHGSGKPTEKVVCSNVELMLKKDMQILWNF
jgi:prolyl oligopeptidase